MLFPRIYASLEMRILSKVRFLRTTSHLNYAENNASSTYYKQKRSKEILTEESVESSKEWEAALPYEAIPGPKPFPIVGNAPRFMFGEYSGLDTIDINKKLMRNYGPIVALRGLPGKKDMVFLYDPVDIEKLFRNEGIFPRRELLPSFCKYQAEMTEPNPGLVELQEEDWFNTRTIVNPILMQPKSILKYTEAIDKVTTDLVKIMKKLNLDGTNNEMPSNFDNLIQKWALETTAYFALNRRLGCLSEKPVEDTKLIITTLSRILISLDKLDIEPAGFFRKLFNTKTWRMFVKDMDFIQEICGKYVLEAIKDIKSKKGENSGIAKSVLEKLLDIDENLAFTLTISIILAGVDTTSKSSGTALYYIAKNKEPQNKIRLELMKLMPTPDSSVTEEVLNNANYLKAAIKESMRLSPVSIANARTSTKEMVLRGYRIPKSTDITAMNSVSSVSEENFERPTEFIPERWLRSTSDKLLYKNNSQFVCLPFGFGPRSCVGQRISSLEMQILIAKIVRNFDMDWPHKDMKFVTNLIQACADPLRIKMVPVAH